MSLLQQASLIVTPNAYKEGKLYSVIPSDGSGDLSVTRATTATRVNSAGLVELVPYNLVGYSEQFDNSYWIKQSVNITSNSIAAPNGTLTADTYQPTSNDSYIFPNANLNLSLGSFSAQIWIKGSPSSIGNTVRFWLWHLTSTGNTGLTTVTLTADWQLVTISASVTGAGDTRLRIDTTNHTNPFYIWGVQLNEGTIAKPYQRTETRLNIPRLDYSNGSCPSLLVEPQRTNLALYSEELDNAYWTKVNATLSANSVVSPSGVQNADQVTFTSGGFVRFNQTPITPLTAYTISAWVKKPATGGANSIRITTNNTAAWNTGISQEYTLTTEWQRIVLSGNIILAGTGAYVIIGGVDATGATDTDAIGIVHIWGAQLELGAYATSYIPTTSASVTRNLDSISKTGISSLLNPSQGTFFVEASTLQGTEEKAIQLSNGSDLNVVMLHYYGGNEVRCTVVGGGSTYLRIVSINVNNVKKMAVSWKSTGVFLYINGVQYSVPLTAGSGGGVPSVLDRLTFSYWWGGFPFLTNTKSVAVWKTALTDNQLEILTGTSFDTYAEMASYYNYTLQ